MATFIGTTGNDLLFGSNDDDILYGNGGNDYLDSGLGNDTLVVVVANTPERPWRTDVEKGFV